MSDLDSLQIQISASTTDAKNKIEELIKSFQKLNGALQNYSGESAYVKGLNRLASGLSGIANASNEINPNRIKDIAKSIGDLATKGEKLSNLSFVKTFQQMGAESERASLRTRKAVDDIKKTFGITSKEGIEALTKSLNRFYASADDPAALASAEKDIKSLIVEYASLNEELLKTGGTLRKFMSGTNFAIPTGAVKEFGDEYNKMIGVLGVNKQHKDLSKGVGLDVVAEEANGVLGTNLDTSSSLAAMESIYNALVQEREEFENLEEAQRKSIATSSELTQYMDRLYESINRVREVSSSISEGGFVTGGGDAELEALFNGEDLPQIEQTAQQVAASLNEVQKEVIETQELANPFEGIVKGVESLSGLTITAEQFGGITVIADSLGKLVGERGEKAATILPQVAQGLQSLSTLNIPDNTDQLMGLANAIKEFGKSKAEKAQGLPEVARGLREIIEIGDIPEMNGIKDLATVIGKFGNPNARTAIENMPKLASAFTELVASISKVPMVSEQTLKLAQAMAQLSTASKSASVSTTKTSSGITMLKNALTSALPSFERTKKHSGSLAAMFGKLYASYFLLIRGFRKLGESIEYSSKLTEVQNVVSHVFGQSTDLVDDFADHAIEDFGMAELSAKQFASRFQAMGTAMGISAEQIASANDLIYSKISKNKTAYKDLGDSMADLSINLTKLTADYASFYNLDYEDVADDMTAIFTGQTRPLRRYGLDLTNATLQEWALKNGLDANIKSMSQAEKTMLRYQYVMSQSGHIMGDFARTADTWANVVRTIGQQFQKLGRIIGEGLINTFKPVLIGFRNFMNTILELTQKTLNAVGKLLGWQIEIEDVGVTMNDGMEDYADSIGGAADNAKKLNAQLRSIDELNNLTSNNDNGSGGGASVTGGGGALGTDTTGGLINFKKYESDIDSWFDLGKRISDKIREALENIKWGEIFQKAHDFGKNLAEFLNGLIQPDTFYQVGRTIANALNTAIEFAFSFGSHFNFKNFGESIANGINGFFETFNFKKFARTINKWVDGIKTTIITAIKKVKWGKIIKGAFDFFTNLDFDVYAVVGLLNIGKIPKLVKNLTILTNALKVSWGNVANKVRDVALMFDLYKSSGYGFTRSLNEGIGELTRGLSGVGKSLIGIGSAVAEFGLLSDGIKDLIVDSDKLGESITKMIAGITAGAVGLTAIIGFPYGLIAAGIIGIAGALVGLKQGIVEINTEKLAESIKKAFITESGVPLGDYIDSVREKIVSMGDGFGIVSEKSQDLQTAKKNVSDVVFEIERIKTEMDAGVKSVEDGTAELDTLFGELQESISTKLGAAAAVLYATFSEDGPIGMAFEWTGDYITETRDSIATHTSDIEKKLDELFTQLQDADYGSNEWNNLYQQIIDLTSGMSETTKAATDLSSAIKSNGLDWSEYFDEDGINVEYLNESLGNLIETAMKVTTALQEDVNAAKEAAADLGRNDIYTDLEDGLPNALKNLNQASATEISALTDTLQVDLIEGLKTIVEDAEKDWENRPLFERLFGDSKEDYIAKRVHNYVSENIDPVSKEIETQMSQLGVDGAGWASDAARDIINSLYFGISDADISKYEAETGNKIDFLEKLGQSIASQGAGLKTIGSDLARDTVDGYLNGITDIPSTDYGKAGEDVIGKTEDSLRTAADSHSPAKRFNPVGEDIVLGVFQGFENIDFVELMTEWWDSNVKPFFSIDKWSELADNATNGLLPGIQTLCTNISAEFIGMANGVVAVFSDMITAINTAFYNLKSPVFNIDGSFDLTNGKVPKIDIDWYADGGFPTPGSLFVAGEAGAEMLGTMNGRTTVASNGEITGISDTIRSTSAEEMQLLRQQNQLLQGILQKEFGITQGELFKSVRSSAMEWKKMTGDPAF